MNIQKIIKTWEQFLIKNSILKKDSKKLSKKIINKIYLDVKNQDFIMGIGIDKLNELTIKKIAFAIAKFFQKTQNKEIVIGHDNRKNSAFYAKIISQVLNQYNVKPILYERNLEQPLPIVSYTIKRLNLDGGIYIGSTNKLQNFNSIKVLNKFGTFINKKEIEEINTFLDNQKLDGIILSNKKTKLINLEIVEEYIKKVLDIQIRFNDLKKITLGFSCPSYFNNNLIETLISKMNINYFFYHKKNQIMKNKKYFKKLKYIGYFKKPTLIAVTDPLFTKVDFIVRKKYRYLKLDQKDIAILYLEYKLNQFKLKQQKIWGVVISANDENFYIKKIVDKFNIKLHIISSKKDENIFNFVQNNKEKVFFIYDAQKGIIINNTISSIPDALQTIIGVIEMTNYYKTQFKNLPFLLKRIKSLTLN